MHQPIVFGHTICPCGKPVLDEIANFTGGRCSDCYLDAANEVFDEITVVTGDRTRLRLKIDRRSRDVSTHNARKRARKTKSKREKELDRLRAKCAQRASRRLRDLFPDLYEVLLADERRKAGLNAFTVNKALTPLNPKSSFDFLAAYHHLTDKAEP